MPDTREQNVARLHIPVDDIVIVRVLQRLRDLKRDLHHAFKLVLVQREPAIEIAMLGNRHDEKAVIIAAVFLNLRVHKLDDVPVVSVAQNGDFIPEASDSIFPLQPLQGVLARKLADRIPDDKDNALAAFIQGFPSRASGCHKSSP